MNEADRVLRDIMADRFAGGESRGSGPPADSARLFIRSLFLTAALENLVERHWMMARESSAPSFSDFVVSALGRELAPFQFLADVWTSFTPESLKSKALILASLRRDLVAESRDASPQAFREFVTAAVREMKTLCAFEESWRERREKEPSLLPASLYRAFEAMDEIFGLNYDDAGMTSSATERLYEGSGARVQTSYPQIFTALAQLGLPRGSRLIDLGSGFGRVGLIAGLVRDDLDCIGYEYVPHRVAVAQAAANRAGIGERSRFFAQDLASETFVIPEADAYYLYDPFTESTYERVVQRIFEVGREKPVTVVTKGASADWFRRAQGEWAGPELCDGGTILIFRSKSQRNAF